MADAEMKDGVRQKLALLLAGENLDSPQQLASFDQGFNRALSSWELFNRSNQVLRDRKAKYREYDRMVEMSSDVYASLDSYAEEATVRNREKDRTIWVHCDNTALKNTIEELFDRIRIEDMIYAIARSVAMYGDDFWRIYYDETGVFHWQWTEPSRLDRITDDMGRLRGYTQMGSQGVQNVNTKADAHPWDFIHFRIRGANRDGWGESMLAGIPRTWRILDQLETALALYRLHRAADRTIFYVDVGGASSDQAYEIVGKWKEIYRKRKWFDSSKNEIDFKHNPIDIVEDIFWPVKKDSQSKVDKLPGSNNVGDIADIEMWRNKLRYGLRIPKGYWGDDDGGVFDAKAGIVQQDMKFARGIERIQRAIISAVTQLIQIHLALLNQNASKQRFKVRMETISYLSEMQRMETLQQRVIVLQGLVEVGQALGLDADAWAEYLMKTVMFTTDDELQEFLEDQSKVVAEKQKETADREGEVADAEVDNLKQFGKAQGAAKQRAKKPGGQSGIKTSNPKDKAVTGAKDKSKKSRLADDAYTPTDLTEGQLDLLRDYLRDNKESLREVRDSIDKLTTNGVVVDLD